MTDLHWAAYASIIYFSIYFVLLMSLAFYLHKTGEYTTKRSFLWAIWKRKGIYGQILVHLYDTATDIGVLVEWWILAQQEKNGQNVVSLDMKALFWTSIAFLIVYRVLCVLIACVSAYHGQFSGWMCFDGFLGLIDMYVIKAVYRAIRDDQEEPTSKQKMIQLGEAVVESLPQVVLQSVFIIRGQNDPVLRERSALYLVGLSLLASLFSITNKGIWVDRECVSNESQDAKAKLPRFCKRRKNKDDENGASKNATSPCINRWYLLRVIWRFSFIVTRFAIVSLVWSVLGGAFVGVFMGSSWILWFIFLLIEFEKIEGFDECQDVCLASVACGLSAIVCLCGSPAYQSYSWAIGHALEVMITLIVITIFAFNSSIECKICADSTHRQAKDNVYILSFIIVGWTSMAIDFITYVTMLEFGQFTADVADVFMFLDGLDDEN